MESPVMYVGKVVGYLVIVLIVYSLIFGDATNELYWGGISNTTNSDWNTYTLDGGEKRYDAYTKLLDNADGETYEAVD